MPTEPGVGHAWLELPTGVRMHVASAGPDDGTPVLSLHGWPQHWWMWRAVIGPLADDGCRVICPDLRGLGWSGWPADGDFAKQRLVDDVLALLDLLGIESTHLLGHDWGGWVGFLLARRAPCRVRRLLACSIVAPWERAAAPGRRDLAFAYQPLLAAPMIGPALVRETGLVAELMRRGTARSYSWPPPVLAAYADAVRTRSAARASSLLYRSFLTRELAVRSTGSPATLPLPMPVLQLVGTEDLVLGRLATRHAGDESWRLELVPGCGHFMLDERPELVAARARSFFAGA